MIYAFIGFTVGAWLSYFLNRSRVTKITKVNELPKALPRRQRRKMIIQTELKEAQFEESNKERL